MNKYFLAISCVLLLLLSGCSGLKPKNSFTLEEKQEVSDHVLSVDKDGTLTNCQDNDDVKCINNITYKI